jgi:serine/threonine-protein kinase RsbW
MAPFVNGPAPHDPDQKCAIIRTMAEINVVIFQLLAEMAGAGYCERELFGIRLALEEAIVNGIKHGNHGDPAKQVVVYYSINPSEIVTEIEDQGAGFNPHNVPSPVAPENLERPGGRGVFLMRQYMTYVQYNERGNRVILFKKKDGKEAEAF